MVTNEYFAALIVIVAGSCLSSCATSKIIINDKSELTTPSVNTLGFTNLIFNGEDKRWEHPLGYYPFTSCETQQFFCVTNSYLPLMLPKVCNVIHEASVLKTIHSGEVFDVFRLRSRDFFAITPRRRPYVVYILNSRTGLHQLYLDVTGGADVAAIIRREGVLAAADFEYPLSSPRAGFMCSPRTGF